KALGELGMLGLHPLERVQIGLDLGPKALDRGPRDPGVRAALAPRLKGETQEHAQDDQGAFKEKHPTAALPGRLHRRRRRLVRLARLLAVFSAQAGFLGSGVRSKGFATRLNATACTSPASPATGSRRGVP